MTDKKAHSVCPSSQSTTHDQPFLAIPFNLNASMQNRLRCTSDVLIRWMENLAQITLHRIFILDAVRVKTHPAESEMESQI